MANTPSPVDVLEVVSSDDDVNEQNPPYASSMTNGDEERTMVDAPNDPNDYGQWWSHSLQRYVAEAKDPGTQCRRNANGTCPWGERCSFVHNPAVDHLKTTSDAWWTLMIEQSDARGSADVNMPPSVWPN
eukprot:15921738-Heterocapsa_arctica.AAC.1